MKACARCRISQQNNSGNIEEFDIFLFPGKSADKSYDSTVISKDSPLFEPCITALANKERNFKVIQKDKTNRTEFELNCRILKYKIYNYEVVNQYKRIVYEHLDLRNDFKTPIYVCGRNTFCYSHNHHLASVKAIVYNKAKTRTVEIVVSKCKDSFHLEKPFLFILYDALKEYEKKYGTLLFNHVPDTSLITDDKYERSQCSKMALNGYSVDRKKGLSAEERHDLLRYFVDTGIVSYVEIQNHLSYLIDQGRDNEKHQEAILKWQNDWDYIRKYVCETDIHQGTLLDYKNRKR